MYLIFIFVSFILFQQGPRVEVDSRISPKPKIFHFKSSKFTNIKIIPEFESTFQERYKGFFTWISPILQEYQGTPVNLRIKLQKNTILPDTLNTYLNQKEAYYLKFSENTITIVGHDSLGVLDGLTTLKKYLVLQNGSLQEGYIIDWPDQNIRALHFVAKGLKKNEALKLLRWARTHQFNTLVVQLADGVRISGTGIPARNDAWSEEFLKRFSRLSREFGLQFVPEIKFLSHQEKFFKKSYPRLMYNHLTYNPVNPKTKRLVKLYLDRIIDLTHPTAIHIGHDEIIGVSKPSPNSKQKLTFNDKPLPASLFKQSILFLYNYLSDKNIKVWMWGDMFLDRTDFPKMTKWTKNGNKAYSKTIDDIPKDIVICDWHYWGNQAKYPSVDYFTSKGFEVIGASWKKLNNIKNFSKYIAKKNGLGMMATTWFHVQREEWGLIDKIIKQSGENFWNAE